MTVLDLAAAAVALVVAPHPDDETLGAGGTIARLTGNGVAVHVLAITCRTAVMWGGRSDSDVRIKEFNTACDALGVTGRTVAWIDDERAEHPHRHPRTLVELIDSGTELSLAHSRPELLLIPAAGGYHQDHRAVHQAGLAAARLGGSAKPTPRLVLGYLGPEEQWTAAAEPTGRIHVDTADVWETKRAALDAYRSQMRTPPHPRSIDAIRVIDAATGLRAGVAMAEAFVPYRVVC